MSNIHKDDLPDITAQWHHYSEIIDQQLKRAQDDAYMKGVARGEASYRENDIIRWGIARNLIGKTGEATRVGQQAKTEEEVRELADAIAADDREEARDSIGDVYVTLVMQAQMWGLTMQECIEAAWNEIKDRKGRMINGVFVKEADLP